MRLVKRERFFDDPIVSIVLVLLFFSVLAWTVGAWQRTEKRANGWENVVLHLQDLCAQATDGSATCAPGAFATTSTTGAR